MPKSPWREFRCRVVNETVLMRLERQLRFSSGDRYFVQCNQAECQYVEDNKPPCPLHLGLFVDAIRERETRRREAAERRVA